MVRAELVLPIKAGVLPIGAATTSFAFHCFTPAHFGSMPAPFSVAIFGPATHAVLLSVTWALSMNASACHWPSRAVPRSRRISAGARAPASADTAPTSWARTEYGHRSHARYGVRRSARTPAVENASRPAAVSVVDSLATALFHRGDDIVLALLLELHMHVLPDS
jgi:hypothetical protein